MFHINSYALCCLNILSIAFKCDFLILLVRWNQAGIYLFKAIIETPEQCVKSVKS